MKKALVTLLSLFVLCAAVAGEWHTDLPKALEQAKAEGKLVLMEFTGSDWCVGCIIFKKKVLDKAAFKEYADKQLVLVEIDFPEKKEQSDALKKANRELEQKYNVTGYPTLVVLNSDGTEMGRLEGFEGSAKSFIKKIEEFRKKD